MINHFVAGTPFILFILVLDSTVECVHWSIEIVSIKRRKMQIKY